MKTSIINHQISISYSKGDTTVCLGCRPAIDCDTQEMVNIGHDLIDVARQILGDPPVAEAEARNLLRDLYVDLKWTTLQERRQYLADLYRQGAEANCVDGLREKIKYAEEEQQSLGREIQELESREDVKQARALLGLPCPPLHGGDHG